MELGEEQFWVVVPGTRKHILKVAPTFSCQSKGKLEGVAGALDPSTQLGMSLQDQVPTEGPMGCQHSGRAPELTRPRL